MKNEMKITNRLYMQAFLSGQRLCTLLLHVSSRNEPSQLARPLPRQRAKCRVPENQRQDSVPPGPGK
ncbi:hypothetical protein UUU_24760 (plasmid) [Klebsiella pneumoniae subsp. pneumoniae DSM 30104 = JCM 1662 = NBRC 14940]|nr:hypothetical protein UUU_24760 [Klebsiella pneumoniae subsp. pneumoniae DSM 30104 = JCM 1662 = NBRC 14940]